MGSPGLEKLGFLVHESLCSSKQVQENIVHLKILFNVLRYTCLPHRVPCHAPNEVSYGKMNQYNKILQFPHVKARRLSKKKKPRLCFTS